MNDQAELRCLVAPTGDYHLLLPGSVVAEVVDFADLRPFENAPDWLLGGFAWQDWSVPVLNFARLAGKGEKPPGGAKHRVLIIKSLDNGASAPYIGLLISGVPSMAKVSAPQLAEPKTDSQHPGVFREVTLGERRVLIPDIDRLNQMVEDVVAQKPAADND